MFTWNKYVYHYIIILYLFNEEIVFFLLEFVLYKFTSSSFTKFLARSDSYAWVLRLRTVDTWRATLGLKAALCGRCVSSERVDNELEIGADIDDGVLYKDKKLKDQVEVAIGDGMEFTIPGINKILCFITSTENFKVFYVNIF